MPAEPFIETHDLTVRFGGTTALDSVDVSVARGTVLGLLGHNGAGKTTLVNVLSTLLKPTSGTARVAGLDVTGDGAAVRSRVGLTGQFAAVDEMLSGRNNLVLLARLLGAGRREAVRRADELIELFELTDAAERRAGSYSGGMRRRLDLAAGMVGRPDVIFLDEPTTGLDPVSRLGLWSVVEGLVGEGATVLLTTQYLEEADRLADSIAVLGSGRILASGTTRDLKTQVGECTVHATLRTPGDLPAAVAALRAAGLTPTYDEALLRLSVPAESSADLAGVVRAVDAAGLTVAALGYAEPTLDDVYLSLNHQRALAAA
jgi:ABC-2 type transport system ATP-binding protein